MNARRILGITVAILVGMFFSANYVVGRIVQDRLPAALSDADGRPVKISNVRANVWRLRAYADELVWGTDDRPFLQFSDVFVELNFQDLLRGVISIDTAGSRDADIYLARFRERESTSDADLSAAERWIPKSIVVGTAEFWDGGRVVHEVADFDWQVLSLQGRRASWTEHRGGKDLQFQLETDDHGKILAERGAELEFAVALPEADEPLLRGTLKSVAADSIFNTEIAVAARSFQGKLSYQTSSLFELPERSSLRIERLLSDELGDMTPLFASNPEDVPDPEAQPRAFLDAPLPQLALPDHELDLEIVEMLGPDDEQIRNIKAQVQLSAATGDQPAQIAAPSYVAELPRGDLNGKLHMAFDTEWRGSFDLEVVTRSRSPEGLRQFASTEWLWESGEATASFQGSTLAGLIESARGELDIEGIYRGRAQIPISIQAQIKDRRGRIGADIITLKLGSSLVTGKVWLQEPREKLYLRLHTESFSAAEFAPAARPGRESMAAGIVIPDFHWWHSALQIDARLTADQLVTSGGTLTALDLNLQRGETGSVIHASFASDRVGTLHAQAHTTRDGDHRSLDLNVQANEIAAAAFDDDLDAKASGQFRLQGEGNSLAELIGNVNTRITGELHFNQTDGRIALSGNPMLRMDEARIVGLNFENIKLNITGEESISGRLVYDVRVPAITGELSSGGFDLDQLLAVLPSSEATRAPEFGSVLAVLPNLNLQLQAESLSGFGEELTQFSVRFENEPEKLILHDLAFNSRFGKLKANASLLDWKRSAQFKLSGNVGDFVVSSATGSQSVSAIDAPLSGTVELSTSGEDWQALAGNLRGHIRLKTEANTAPEDQINVDLEVSQQGAGIVATLRQLGYGPSQLSGNLTFIPGPIAQVTIDASSEHLDLIALDALFEEPADEQSEQADQPNSDSLAAQANEIFDSVRSILGSPFQFFTGDAASDSDRFFDDTPVDLSLLKTIDGTLSFQLKNIVSAESVFDELSLTGTTSDGILDLKLSANQDLGGTLSSGLRVDSNVEPAAVRLSTDIRNFRTGPEASLAPTSIFADMTAAGNSQAALAGSANGELYVETGKGEADFATFTLGFFTQDLLTRVGRVLLPDDNDETPTLNCTVAFGQVNDGVLTTPKAMVIQSRTANILIRSEVDMKKERLTAQFDTRSRTGAGVSVGNVFSNTVRIRGPLKDPALVPNATGIIWRGWAALATGGLSLLGESFVKRVLSSDKACQHLRDDVQKMVCDGDTPAASSTLVCPNSADPAAG